MPVLSYTRPRDLAKHLITITLSACFSPTAEPAIITPDYTPPPPPPSALVPGQQNFNLVTSHASDVQVISV